MNIHNEEQDVVDNSAYNPFPEPQTIPSGWDFAALMPEPEVDSVMDEEDSIES
jgi:hypothetical protein